MGTTLSQYIEFATFQTPLNTRDIDVWGPAASGFGTLREAG